MATRKRRRKGGRKKAAHHKGHIPLPILEKRARRLVKLVNSRGGSV